MVDESRQGIPVATRPGMPWPEATFSFFCFFTKKAQLGCGRSDRLGRPWLDLVEASPIWSLQKRRG